MELQKLAIDIREEADGKGANHRLRKTGQVPVVLYGGSKESVSVQVNEKEFVQLIRGRGGEHAIVQLECSSQPALNSPAMLKAVQHHPIRGNVLHADFMRIRLDERIRTVVPLVLTGQPKGVVEGGILDHQVRELEVECLALEVPENRGGRVRPGHRRRAPRGERRHPRQRDPADGNRSRRCDRTAPRTMEEAAAPAEGEAVEGEGAEGETGEE